VYKIDELVVVVRNIAEHGFSIGEVVRVKSVDTKGRIFACDNLKGNDFWFMDDKEVRKLTDEELEFVNSVTPHPEKIVLVLEVSK
jgi:hypothetical protein